MVYSSKQKKDSNLKYRGELAMVHLVLKIEIMKKFSILFCIFILFSCKKEQIPAKTALSFKLLWKEKMTENPVGCSSQEPVILKDKVIFHKMFDGPNDIFTARNKTNGAKIWSWKNLQDVPDGEFAAHYATIDDKFAICSWNQFNIIETNNGQTLWRTDAQSENLSGQPRFALLNRTLFHERYLNQEKSTLCRTNINNGAWETIFEKEKSQNQGYISSFESYAIYPKSDGDTLLLFQNRQINFKTFKDRIDLYALNLRTKQVEWKRDSIDPDGNSSVQSMLIDGDKVYFMGVVSLFCIDVRDGKTIWQKRFNTSYPYDQLNETLLFTQLFIRENKLLVKPMDGHLYAIDLTNGNEVWSVNNSGFSPQGFGVYKDLLMISCSGDEGVWAHRISDGKLMARLRSPHKGDSKYGGAGILNGIAVDEKEGLLFCTDGYFAMCFKFEY
jgi:outer membrane protein assembly factor BamB